MMARSFGGSNYFTIGSAIRNTTPFSWAGWAYPTSLASAHTIACISGSSSSNGHYLFIPAAGADNLIARSVEAGVTRDARTTATVSANTWFHACGVWSTTTSRTVYLNGGNAVENTGSSSPTGLANTGIGAETTTGGPTKQWVGRLAEVALWNVVLVANEVRWLARGVSPLCIRPDALIGYWPLLSRTGNAIDYSSGGNNLTDTNTVGVAEGPPTQPPFGLRRRTFISVASGLALVHNVNENVDIAGASSRQSIPIVGS
jgi:hypothetical protein